MSTVSNHLETWVRAFQSNPEDDAIRQKYIDELSKLHQKVYHESAKFFGNGFYIRSAHRIEKNKILPEILPLAQDVVNKEKLLHEAIFSKSKEIGALYKNFSQSYEQFFNSYHEIIIKKLIPDSAHAKQCQNLNPDSDRKKSMQNLSLDKEKKLKNQESNSLQNEIEMQVF